MNNTFILIYLFSLKINMACIFIHIDQQMHSSHVYMNLKKK